MRARWGRGYESELSYGNAALGGGVAMGRTQRKRRASGHTGRVGGGSRVPSGGDHVSGYGTLSTSTRQACRGRAMYSGNRSGGQGFWEGGGAVGAEGPGPAGTQNPALLFTPSTYERLALLLGSIALLGVGNNLLVLVLYYKFQRLRTPTHLFLVNISLSDLLVSVFGVTFNFVSCLRNGWVWDSAGCMWDGFSSSLFEKFQSQMRM